MARNFPEQEERVETGAVQFGDDWPGLFIRGDDAYEIALAIKAIEEGNLDLLKRMPLSNIKNLIFEEVIKNEI